ncbi:nucleotidyl transferase AbiEii/AbiGii toxin family protein [Paraburkholderia sediminicola]|uniref:nucleotidyl transferase AbiEii/AbiGii toxin family protein n=1 Tax=Paraburkholderia sediminicola TaxID=458836 RepID=UPI0038BC5512
MALTEKELPSGVWQELLPKALTLVDEISKYGGVPDPFFTFGGGTVLMLRYQHRFSKDIDIFVPDPQSLGFVTPRLSDTAQVMCNDQYVEAALFVKLVLEAGEIDFVAAPNLLPAEHAFESWRLCGRDVRVETAAEIVAKKMYHRGAQATARDLFDLSFVVEHEPSALANALPFMYRHLDAFRGNLKSASSNYVKEFESVARIGYSPSFEHAVDVTLHYLDGLDARKTISEQKALDFVESMAWKVERIDQAKGEYAGPIVHQTASHFIQSLGRGIAAVHDRHKLLSNIQVQSNASLSVRVKYRDGEISLTARPPRTHDQVVGR